MPAVRLHIGYDDRSFEENETHCLYYDTLEKSYALDNIISRADIFAYLFGSSTRSMREA